MKKFFLTLATISFVALAASCNKEGGKDQKGDDQKDEPAAFEVAIDGSFADWDALTTEVATANDVIAVNAGSGVVDANAQAISVIKATSDDQYIYMYAEIAADKVQLSEKASPWGNSNDGHGDATPGPLTIYLDLDGNAATGFTAHCNSDGDPKVANIGCEVGIELYIYIDAKDGGAKCGWAQIVYEPDGASDGDEYQCGAWWGLENPQGGWAPDYDNTCPSPDNYAAKFEGGKYKVEFAMGRGLLAGLCKRGHDMQKSIVFGAKYENAAQTASWGTSGLIPATALELK